MKVLDIYCGAGGLASGFKKADFEVIGVDISKDAGRTFKFNKFGSFIQADLSATPVDGNYDGIIGGPPCKPWSSVNLRRRGKKHKDYSLLLNYFNHIEHHLPAFFLLENVPPITIHSVNLLSTNAQK